MAPQWCRMGVAMPLPAATRLEAVLGPGRAVAAAPGSNGQPGVSYRAGPAVVSAGAYQGPGMTSYSWLRFVRFLTQMMPGTRPLSTDLLNWYP